MDIPIKYLVGFLIIFLVVFGVEGYIFTDTAYAPPSFENFMSKPEGLSTMPFAGWIIHGLGKLLDMVTILFDVLTFNIPRIPDTVRIVLNFIMLPMLFAFILGIYPILKDFIDALTKMIENIPFIQ